MNITSFFELKSIMEEQSNLLNAVLELEKEKNTLLTEGLLNDFSSLNTILEEFSLKLNDLDTKRELLIKKLLNDQDINESQSSILQQLLTYCPDKTLAKDIEEIFEDMKKIVNEMKYFVEINEILLTDSIKVLDIITSNGDLDSKEINYTNQNKKDLSKQAPLFLDRLV